MVSVFEKAKVVFEGRENAIDNDLATMLPDDSFNLRRYQVPVARVHVCGCEKIIPLNPVVFEFVISGLDEFNRNWNAMLNLNGFKHIASLFYDINV